MENLTQFITFTTLVAGAFILIVNLAFAIGVNADANWLRTEGRTVISVGPFGWAIAVFFGSFLVVALYWAIHHSTFVRPLPSRLDQGS